MAEGWNSETGLNHVIAYSDPTAEKRNLPGVLDDYAFTAIACLDAYEATSDLSYFQFAQSIVDRMVQWFYDSTGGGFFDTAQTDESAKIAWRAWALGANLSRTHPRPPGNSVAAIALLRLHAFTNQSKLP